VLSAFVSVFTNEKINVRKPVGENTNIGAEGFQIRGQTLDE